MLAVGFIRREYPSVWVCVAAARVCVLSMSELEMVDAAVGMGCELTIISLTHTSQEQVCPFEELKKSVKTAICLLK